MLQLLRTVLLHHQYKATTRWQFPWLKFECEIASSGQRLQSKAHDFSIEINNCGLFLDSFYHYNNWWINQKTSNRLLVCYLGLLADMCSNAECRNQVVASFIFMSSLCYRQLWNVKGKCHPQAISNNKAFSPSCSLLCTPLSALP